MHGRNHELADEVMDASLRLGALRRCRKREGNGSDNAGTRLGLDAETWSAQE